LCLTVNINYTVLTAQWDYLPKIQINQLTRCNSFESLLLDIYVWLNMFRAPLCPSSGAYNCTRSLWFYHWSMAVGTLLVVIWQVNYNLPDHDQQGSNRHAPTVKPEAPSEVVRSWWWAERCLKHGEPHKHHVINMWNYCILLVDLFESYDDARTCEHQIYLPKITFTLMQDMM